MMREYWYSRIVPWFKAHGCFDVKMEMEETYICFQVRDRYLYTTMLDYFLSQKISGCFSWHWNIYFDTKWALPRSTWIYRNRFYVWSLIILKKKIYGIDIYVWLNEMQKGHNWEWIMIAWCLKSNHIIIHTIVLFTCIFPFMELPTMLIKI